MVKRTGNTEYILRLGCILKWGEMGMGLSEMGFFLLVLNSYWCIVDPVNDILQ